MDNLREIRRDQYVEFCEAWNFFDPEGKGFILTNDFGTVLRCLNITITEDEKINLLNTYDPDNIGRISFNTFINILILKSNITTDVEEVQAAFRIFDKDKKQCLSIDKFKLKLKEKEFHEILNDIDIEFLG